MHHWQALDISNASDVSTILDDPRVTISLHFLFYIYLLTQ